MHFDYHYLIGKIQSTLAADSRVNALDVNVAVLGNTIYLRGEIETEERKSFVTDIIKEILPDFIIHNELTILSVSNCIQSEMIHD